MLGAPPSFLLSSIAWRSCSASSYAASRLFIVDRRLWAKFSALGRDNFDSLVFRDVISRCEGSGEACAEASSCTGRYRECFCLHPGQSASLPTT